MNEQHDEWGTFPSERETVIEQLIGALTPPEPEKKGKYLLVVNGDLVTDRFTKAEVEKIAQRLAPTDAKIEVFKKHSEAMVDMPVTFKED